MPLIKVIRHGFEFLEMTPAPKEQQLGELPERGRDKEMGEEFKQAVSRRMKGNQNRRVEQEETESAEVLQFGVEDAIAYTKREEERADFAEGADSEPEVGI